MTNQTKIYKNTNDITYVEIENLISQLEAGETKEIMMMKIKLFVKFSEYDGENANKLREIFKSLDKEFVQLGEEYQINYYCDRLYQELKMFLGIEDLVGNVIDEDKDKDKSDYMNKEIEDYLVGNNYQDDENLNI